MNTIFYNPTIRGLLSLWLLFICLAIVWAIVRLWQQKRYRLLIPAVLFFLGCDVYWQYLNAYSFYVGYNAEYYKIDYAPIWSIVLANTVLTIISLLLIVHIIRWQKKHISAVSVKEGFDTLSAGICFYEKGGRIYLVNRAMHALTNSLVGKRLSNGENLWSMLKQASLPLEQENKAVVRIADKTYAFIRYQDMVGGQELYEIIAADITKEAEQNRQLEEKNEQLQRLNMLLQEHNKNLAEAVRERKILQSKARIHDDMNVLLIKTMHSTQNYNAKEAAEVAALWNSNILELQKDTTPYQKNPLDTIHTLADSLGITLVFEGDLPQDTACLRLFIASVSECIVNAIRHAGAQTVFVTSDETGFTVTNDGNPPKGNITEGGGITNLRKRAQKIGADIEIQSLPVYKLTITY